MQHQLGISRLSRAPTITAWCSCWYSIFQIKHAVYSEVGIRKLYNCGVSFCHALESPLLIFSPLLLSLTDLLFDVPHNRITIQLITFLHLEVHYFSKLSPPHVVFTVLNSHICMHSRPLIDRNFEWIDPVVVKPFPQRLGKGLTIWNNVQLCQALQLRGKTKLSMERLNH